MTHSTKSSTQHRRNIGEQLCQPRQLHVAKDPTLLEKMARIFCCCCFKAEETSFPSKVLRDDFFGFTYEGSGKSRHLVIHPPERIDSPSAKSDVFLCDESNPSLQSINTFSQTKMEETPLEEFSSKNSVTLSFPRLPQDSSLESFVELSTVESPQDKSCLGKELVPRISVPPSMSPDCSLDSLNECNLESQFRVTEGVLVSLRGGE